MSFHPRKIMPPGASKKRKERESFYNPAPLPNHRVTTKPGLFVKPPRADVPSAHPAQAKGQKSPHNTPPIDNRLLAGYMAHEFLTRGTLLGQRFDPGRADVVAVAGEVRRNPVVAEPSQRKGKETEEKEKEKEKEMEGETKQEHRSYADVAGMLRSDGVHILGVVNPSQLVTWLRQ